MLDIFCSVWLFFNGCESLSPNPPWRWWKNCDGRDSNLRPLEAEFSERTLSKKKQQLPFSVVGSNKNSKSKNIFNLLKLTICTRNYFRLKQFQRVDSPHPTSPQKSPVLCFSEPSFPTWTLKTTDVVLPEILCQGLFPKFLSNLSSRHWNKREGYFDSFF